MPAGHLTDRQVIDYWPEFEALAVSPKQPADHSFAAEHIDKAVGNGENLDDVEIPDGDLVSFIENLIARLEIPV